ncbi:MAG: acetyl-CoA carboxylase biotin carboxyl carrier protein [Deltaproteobacteria bacterium]|nr:acetyl-CoA carboxylase biotin carboxyl carrier protein [Deltaproteobacteria bacterium]MCF8118604.1 acetyl-CoA carboxylase biotin carboxyl carrier protein [Deltaproteobacteria bacterium]
METISQDEVIQILKIVEESSFDELCLEMGDFKLVLKKHGDSEPVQGAFQSGERVPHPEGARGQPPVTTHIKQGEPEVTATVPEREGQKGGPVAGNQEEGYIPIRAPMLGTFYRAPKPGAPPFVEVGQLVSGDDSVCIIEVMKLFNTVKANVEGRVVKICAENGQMVEYLQTLFLVEEVNATGGKGQEEIAS